MIAPRLPIRDPHGRPVYRTEMVDYVEADAYVTVRPPRDPRVLDHPEYQAPAPAGGVAVEPALQTPVAPAAAGPSQAAAAA